MKCWVKACPSSSVLRGYQIKAHQRPQGHTDLSQHDQKHFNWHYYFILTSSPKRKRKPEDIFLLHQLLGVSKYFASGDVFALRSENTGQVQANDVTAVKPVSAWGNEHGCHLAMHHLSPSHPKIIFYSVLPRSLVLVPEAGLKKLMNFTKATSALGLNRGTPLIYVN